MWHANLAVAQLSMAGSREVAGWHGHEDLKKNTQILLNHVGKLHKFMDYIARIGGPPGHIVLSRYRLSRTLYIVLLSKM